MPNWTSNTLRFRGNHDKLVELLARISTKVDDEDDDVNIIDFDKIVPIDKSKYLVKTWKNEKEKAPWDTYNDASASVIMITPVEDSTETNDKGDRFIGWSFDWYRAQNENWGTKWNACHAYLQWRDEEEVILAFDTAWDIPEPVIDALCSDADDSITKDIDVAFYATEESYAFFIYGGKEGIYHSTIDEVMSDEMAHDAIRNYLRGEGENPDDYDIEAIFDDGAWGYSLEYGDCFDGFDDVDIVVFEVNYDDYRIDREGSDEEE